ncbi:MAG: phosphoribosylanthranilate isomerase [Fimbriimonadaceae bacterium]|nr:phosphoribosylanthranilate isomerase [Fimbriimonadaceae bacterium]
MVKIKFCGFTRIEDAEFALSLGVDAMGVVFQPNSPRNVAPDADIVEWIGAQSGVRRTAVMGTCAGRPVPAAFDAVQAVDVLEWKGNESKWLAYRPGGSVWNERILTVDGLLVDAYHPEQFGGTGHRVELAHWEEVRRLWDRELWLAGGLSPDNVAEAIQLFRPDGVDLASGIESAPGVKDRQKMTDFVQAVREASQNVFSRE